MAMDIAAIMAMDTAAIMAMGTDTTAMVVLTVMEALAGSTDDAMVGSVADTADRSSEPGRQLHELNNKRRHITVAPFSIHACRALFPLDCAGRL